MEALYCAVLREVSPPTAWPPIAAAAISSDPYPTTLQAWKHALPAFLVAFMFVLGPAAAGRLLKGLFDDTVLTMSTELIGIAALAGGAQSWFLTKTSRSEHAVLIAGRLLLVSPGPVAATQRLRKS